MSEKILFVDDEIEILRAISRNLMDEFEIETMTSGPEALDYLEKNGPCAVVVSDFRMPEMDGIQFLAQVRERFPDIVRIMLTGYADLKTSIQAVNEGHVFRFLTKPCPTDILESSVRAGLDQYHLLHAERDLLEKTFSGIVKVLAEILSLVNPVAFSKSMRIQQYVRHIVKQLELKELWRFQVAALLSQIGCVTLTPEIFEKLTDGKELTPKEAKLLRSHPAIGRKLLEKIPRMESIAIMIGNQFKPYKSRGVLSKEPSEKELILLGGDILRVCLLFDELLMKTKTVKRALAELKKPAMGCNPELIRIISGIETDSGEVHVISVYLDELSVGMVLQDHVRARNNGMLLATKGQQVSPLMIERLQSFAKTSGVIEPFYVSPARSLSQAETSE